MNKKIKNPYAFARGRGRIYLPIGNRYATIINTMESDFLKALDEYFLAQYSDYVKITAIQGYVMPEIVTVGADGNIRRKNSEVLRLNRQDKAEELLRVFKSNLADTDFTFNFRFRKFSERMHDPFRKETFAKLLPAALARVGDTAESAGKKLSLSPKIWKKIVKGKLYPEKNTVIALALVTGMQREDVERLMNVFGYSFRNDSVRDVVCEYLLVHGVFNAAMRDQCLAEYKITTLPIRGEEVEAEIKEAL